MSKDRSGSEGFLEAVEGCSAGIIEVPVGTFAGEPGEWNSDLGIVLNEMVVEISKSKEGLNVFDFMRFWPILNSLDFVSSHGQTIRREDVA